MIIKVCGITNLEDALRAVEYGANALGFNFYAKSPRYISLPRAQRIVEQLPEDVLTVGVVVASPRSSVISHWFLQAIQVHGLRSVEEIPTLEKRVFVATDDVGFAGELPECHELILDGSWGRGIKANWEELRKIKRPFILSGGLTTQNVAEAIETLRPVGVDVCSGVESEPGRKDREKLKRFIEVARNEYENTKTPRH